jgi:hypothetical protein
MQLRAHEDDTVCLFVAFAAVNHYRSIRRPRYVLVRPTEWDSHNLSIQFRANQKRKRVPRPNSTYHGKHMFSMKDNQQMASELLYLT